MKKIFQLYIKLMLPLSVLYFWPWSTDAFGFGKVTWMLLTGAIGLALWAIMMVVEKRERFNYHTLWLLGVGMLVTATYSFFAKIPVGIRVRTMMEPVGMGLLLAIVIWGFLWLQVREEEQVDGQWKWLTGAGIIAALLSVVVFLLPTKMLPLLWPKDNPLLIVNNGWSITGSLVAEIFLLLVLVVEWGGKMWRKLKEEKGNYVVEAVITAFLGLAAMLDGYRIIKIGWSILDLNSAWVIAVEGLKRSPLWGMGIGTFAESFMSLRPATYNLTKFWSVSFSQSSAGLLQVWTELGLVGLILGLMMAVMVVIKGKKSFGDWRRWIKALLAVVAIGFLPLSVVTVWVGTWIVLSSIKGEKVMGWRWKVGENGLNIAPIVTMVVILGGLVGLGIFESKVLLGEYYFRASVIAASKNDGSGAYNYQIKAIAANPNVAGYRKAYSQTNMALALGLLQNKDLSDDDKQKASMLVQQAVREAKAAVTLDDFNADYWNNLAVIYKQIVGLVDGAADWSLQAYQQATALDPVSPTLKLDMGGLLYAAKNYMAADRVFEQAVTAKGDYANAWYNWAYTAKNNNMLADAVQRMTQAVSLVDKTSADYEKANQELETWTKEYNEAVKKAQDQAKKQQVTPTPQPAGSELKVQEPLPTMGKEEKVNVPANELVPPAVSPTPSEVTQP